MNEKTTRGVQILRGESKTIIRLSTSMMIGMLIQTVYNLARGD